jgi:hypothetical protein
VRKFFGESALFHEDEKEEAKQYLLLWKKYFIRNLSDFVTGVTFIDEEWIERNDFYSSPIHPMIRISLKLCIEAKYKYELES